MNRWYDIRAAAGGYRAEVRLYDEIGKMGITALRFVEDLAALGEIEEIDVRINSNGGDVYDSISMYNALIRHPAKIIVHIDGIAASGASMVAMAGDLVLMPRNALMMIHSPWAGAVGNAIVFREKADAMDKAKASLVMAYSQKSGLLPERIEKMMDEETWLTAEEAVSLHLADDIDSIEERIAACVPREVIATFNNYQERDCDMAETTAPVAAAEETADTEAAESEDMSDLEVMREQLAAVVDRLKAIEEQMGGDDDEEDKEDEEEDPMEDAATAKLRAQVADHAKLIAEYRLKDARADVDALVRSKAILPNAADAWVSVRQSDPENFIALVASLPRGNSLTDSVGKRGSDAEVVTDDNRYVMVAKRMRELMDGGIDHIKAHAQATREIIGNK